MNIDNGDHPKSRKKPYRRPEMLVVALRPDEAVLGACKTASANGPGSKGSCSPAICRSRGS